MNKTIEEKTINPAHPNILTINGGSSIIKFALFESDDPLQQVLSGAIERIGLSESTLRVKDLNLVNKVSQHLFERLYEKVEVDKFGFMLSGI